MTTVFVKAKIELLYFFPKPLSENVYFGIKYRSQLQKFSHANDPTFSLFHFLLPILFVKVLTKQDIIVHVSLLGFSIPK